MKGEAFWIAGTGFSAIQIFFFLEKWWSYTIYTLFCLFCIVAWNYTPRELKLLYWIIVSLIFTIMYYLLKPENTSFLM